MYVDTELKQYSEVFEFNKDDQLLTQNATRHKKETGNDLVIAQSHNKDKLKKLQDDLRKAGYKKIR